MSFMRRSQFALIVVGALVASTFTATFGSTAAQAATVTIPAGSTYGCSIRGTYDIDDATGVASNGSSCIGTLTLDPRVISVAPSGFIGATNLTSLTLDSALTTIGYYAFAYAPLTSLTLDSALTSIGDYAFFGAQLTSLTLDSALTTIVSAAFWSSPLTSLTLDNALTSIGTNAFHSAALTCFTNPSAAPLIGTGLETFTALPHCVVPDNGAAQRAAAEQAAAAAKAKQDQDITAIVSSIVGAVGAITSGVVGLAATVEKNRRIPATSQKVLKKKLKKKAKTKK